MDRTTPTPKIKKRNKRRLVAKICGLVLCFSIIFALTVHSLLSVFMDDYYPTFGKYRLFSVVTDSMESEIPTGSLIVCEKPTDKTEIKVGSIITFAIKLGDSKTLYTHRVVEVHVSETGIVSYTTKGDNAPDVDAIRPRSTDVVGVYTGRKCGFIGYVFGFLRSTEGAIALIIIALIAVLAFTVVRFVNLVNAWRRIAVDALSKSRGMLAETQDEKMGIIADVIGIVSKDPTDKADLKRKDKKLGRFIRTGSLPKRPYSNDLDDDDPQLQYDFENAKLPATQEDITKEDITQEVKAQEAAAQEVKAQEDITQEAEAKEFVAAGGRAENARQRFFENAKSKPSQIAFAFRLISLNGKAKAWYSAIKNELMSYSKMRARLGKRCETFMHGRKAVARLSVRGKTLRLALAVDPAEYYGTKFAVERVNSTTPAAVRIKSDRKAARALEMIGRMMPDAEKDPNFVPREYYLSADGIVAPKHVE